MKTGDELLAQYGFTKTTISKTFSVYRKFVGKKLKQINVNTATREVRAFYNLEMFSRDASNIDIELNKRELKAVNRLIKELEKN